MTRTERISWHTCPVCGARAAVGWIGTTPVEMDCFNECNFTAWKVALFVGAPLPVRAVPPTPPGRDFAS